MGHTDTPPGTEDQQPAPSERRHRALRLMSWRSPTTRPLPWWKYGTSSHLACSTELSSTPCSTYGTSSHLPYSTKLPSTLYSTYRTSSHLAYSTKVPYSTLYSSYGTSSHLAYSIKSPYSIKTRHGSLQGAVEASQSVADSRQRFESSLVQNLPWCVRVARRDQTRSTGCSASALVWTLSLHLPGFVFAHCASALTS